MITVFEAQGREHNIELAIKLAASQAELHTIARHLDSSRRNLREMKQVLVGTPL